MVRRFSSGMVACALSIAALAPAAVHADVLTYTASPGSTPVSGSFGFDTVARTFSNVQLSFAGTVPGIVNPVFTTPFLFTSNALGTVAIGFSTQGGTSGISGSYASVGARADFPGRDVTDAAIEAAGSNYLMGLVAGTVSAAAGAPVDIDWHVLLIDGDGFLIGQSESPVRFDVSLAASTGGGSGGVTTVPEPGALALALAAFGGLAFTRRSSPVARGAAG